MKNKMIGMMMLKRNAWFILKPIIENSNQKPRNSFLLSIILRFKYPDFLERSLKFFILHIQLPSGI